MINLNRKSAKSYIYSNWQWSDILKDFIKNKEVKLEGNRLVSGRYKKVIPISILPAFTNLAY